MECRMVKRLIHLCESYLISGRVLGVIIIWGGPCVSHVGRAFLKKYFPLFTLLLIRTKIFNYVQYERYSHPKVCILIFYLSF